MKGKILSDEELKELYLRIWFMEEIFQIQMKIAKDTFNEACAKEEGEK